MLSSFLHTNLRHQEIFDVGAFSGLNITFDSPTQSKDTTISTVIFLQPLSISIVRGEGGKPETRSNQTTNVKFNYQKTNEKGSIIMNLGTSQFFFVNIKPIPNIGFSAQASVNRGSVCPSIGTNLVGKHFYFRSMLTMVGQKLISVTDNKFNFFDVNRISTIDTSINLGRNDFSAGLQIVRRFLGENSRWAYSVLVQKEWDNNNSAFDIAAVADPLFNLCLRYQRQVNPNWKFGITFATSKYIEPRLQLTCKANLGKSTVHSSILTTGVVESKFTSKVSDTFTITVASILDHPAKNYKLGLGFYSQ
ncbi:hypothetical protein TVAG_450220 [Trichomonas vaginalis G3]|uniref:Uncharacterized protein n=1 Tax=Trichomonas vaginalis (strain ATCC PRA-98 / G3) TaxID=412133 RepID=A2G8G1_TRIV3|nr:porin domain-containing protein [Trichomonas vaginalis G3]EAX86553.1 hypothetical protein TVAG_450220 [Trichomonas vaginalis G3]KAI5529851.1 porin domain-containing protein [Trichomonas vaginalis G3]|eukprot:XP_001299483.1 hypothetical protein [Trichomonas vaginalis G3]